MKYEYLEIPHSESKKIQGSLNIDYHTKRLILIAMGRCKNKSEQATALGISIKYLYILKKKYSL